MSDTTEISPRERLLIPSINPRLQSLPERFHQLRDGQVDAIQQTLDHYRAGKQTVVLDAPTGTGKTLIGEVVRRMIGTQSAFVCSGKELQAQFSRDFSAPILMGRSNYIPTNINFDHLTCAECQRTSADDDCPLCVDTDECPYMVARKTAEAAPVAALNAHYWLGSVKSPKSPWSHRGLTIIDECDTLESALMSSVEIAISDRFADRWKIEPPNKMTKTESWQEWGLMALNRLRDAQKELSKSDPLQNAKAIGRIKELREVVQGMIWQLVDDVPWVYTGGAGSERRSGSAISFKPVKVDVHGKKMIWPHSKRFLLMSGSVVSAQMTLDDLGYEADYGVVNMQSTFPVKNRPVVVRAVQDMSRKGQIDGLDKLLTAIESSCTQTSDRILIHAVSYQLSQSIFDHLRRNLHAKAVFTYTNAGERSVAIDQYKRTPGSVLVAPSAERGIDLPGDLCRLQLIAKVPFPYLGDQQIQARTYNTQNGRLWYQVQVARTIMQMVGRGVRSETDWCNCVILDSQFESHWQSWKQLYPLWFRKAVRFERAL